MRSAAVTGTGALVASLLVAAGPAGCTSADTAGCAPSLDVAAGDPRPGQIVAITGAEGCRGDLAVGDRLRFRIRPADGRIPISQASTSPDADGSFEVSIQISLTLDSDRAVATIENYWDVVDCPSADDCETPSVEFDVAR